MASGFSLKNRWVRFFSLFEIGIIPFFRVEESCGGLKRDFAALCMHVDRLCALFPAVLILHRANFTELKNIGRPYSIIG